MRYARTPGWVYVMLTVMGIGFAAGAVAFYLFVPQPTGTIVGAIWLVMGGGMAFFSVRALRGRRDDARIARDGIAATATLLAANGTSWVINGVPQWNLRLRIEGAGSPYETTLKLLTYSPPADGATFGVRVDPARRDHVVMSGDGAAGVSSSPAGSSYTIQPGGANAAAVEAAVAAALRQAGLGGDGVTTSTNPDGSRTISSTTFSTVQAEPDAADTVRLLADLERMRANGTLGAAEFDALKRKLLGEA
jgi:hypothetical protein